MHHCRSRHTDSNGIFRLADSPFQHSKILFGTRRSQINHIRDVADKRNIEETQMSHIVHSGYCPHKHSDHRRISIDTQILRQLVIATLDKSTVNPVHRTSATGSDTRCQCHGMFLGNTYIHKLTPCLFPAFRSKTYHSRSTRADGNNRVVLLHFLQQKLPGQAMVILHTAAIHLRLTRFQIERHLPMKFLPVGFCRSVSLSFLCVNMNHCGT